MNENYNPNLHQNGSVYWRLINDIVQGIHTRKYKVGSRLPSEKEFMEALNLSRGSVREGIKILSALGIVSIRRGEGTFVSSADDTIMMDSIVYTLLMESTSPEEALEFRHQIDNMVLRTAVQKVTASDIEELEALLQQMQAEYEKNNLKRVRELDVQFHLRIVDFTHNQFIKKMVSGVYEFIAPEIIMKNPNCGEFFDEAESSHVDILNFLRTRDYEILEKTERYQRSRIWYRYHAASEETEK